VDRLNRLLDWFLGPWEKAVLNDLVHEKRTIAGKQPAFLSLHDFQQVPIIRVVVISDIDPKQPQVSDQFP
jgi:hypothetical protein